MKICPYCKEDLPEDTIYCIKCGKPLEEVKVTLKKDVSSQPINKSPQEIEKQRNIWAPLGIILFLIGLVGLDGIVATVISAMNMDYKWVFIVSAIIYVGAIGCGIMALLTDRKYKKVGKKSSGSYPMATASIMISAYILLVNIQQVILK